MTATDLEPLFVPIGDDVEPTRFARGPWDPSLLHGGAVAALVAERLQDALGATYQPSRLTVDLVRPVPLSRLGVDVEVVRAGARLGAARATVRDGERVVVAATLLGIRPAPIADPPPNPVRRPSVGPSAAVDRWELGTETDAFLGGGMTFRFVDAGSDGDVVWLRLVRPVLAGRSPSPLARVAAASDVPSVVASFDGIRYPGVGFVNADIDVHLHRPPLGDWVWMTARARWEASGIGTVRAAVGDEEGAVGTAVQSLLLADGLTLP